MQYEDALKEWGARKLEARYRFENDLNRNNILVTMDFNEGYNCCGGTDPDCYCSLVEAPSANVQISYSGPDGRHEMTIVFEDFDFVKVLGEIVDAANGVVTS